MSTIPLADGRSLSYAEYGNLLGKPVFFFHGTPGSQLFHPPDEITTRHGVHLICVSRPGYGASTYQPSRRLLDWPADISRLADALHIQEFAVVGHSGGGPHALACAFSLPDRVTSAVTLSGAGPADAPGATDGLTALNRFGFKFARYLPWPLTRLITWIIFRRRAQDPASEMDREIGKRPAADDEILANPAIHQLCVQTEIEAFRNGLKGMSWEVRLITSSWGFRLEEIQPFVHIWHGTQDNVTSITMAQFMSRMIPHNHLYTCPGEGHMLLFPHWDEILNHLFSE